MAGYVGRLEPGQTLEPAEHFAGPWRSFQRMSLEPGHGHTFDAADSEHAVFVMSGTCVSTVANHTRVATPGSTFTVGYRAQLRIEAIDEPVELFVTTLDVRA